MVYLLDSVILIDHFNNIPQASEFLQQHKDSSATSVITRAEVLTGFAPEHRNIAAKFLDCFVILNIDKDVADLTAQLRYHNAGNCLMLYKPLLHSIITHISDTQYQRFST